MSGGGARYDGHADWYDETFSAFYAAGEEARFLAEWLEPGRGRTCVDVACGTGLHTSTLLTAGYLPVGFDISGDQLRVAGRRMRAVVRADAGRLPLKDEAVDVAVALHMHTDVEDLASVLREVRRCLRIGGGFVYIGLHPCFVGPFIDRSREAMDERLELVEGYGHGGWADRGSGGGAGLWSRVGGHHKTLTEFLTALLEAPLTLRVVRELAGGGRVVPRNIGLVAEKSFVGALTWRTSVR